MPMTQETPNLSTADAGDAISSANSDPNGTAPKTPELPPAAQRALAEAAERRKQAEAEAAAQGMPKELGGRDGPEPVRYGDWERKGIAVDF